jgi:uncharacterized protein (TIGR02145 family)
MSENMNYDRDCANTTWVPETDTGWCGCVNSSSTLCDTYGKLYQWSATMNETTTEGTQGICPDGWHIPSASEFDILTSFLSSSFNPQYQCGGNSTYIAKSLASNYNWTLNSTECSVGNNQETNNITGFNALPGGARGYTSSSFSDFLKNVYFWSSSFNGTNAFCRSLDYRYNLVYNQNFSRHYAFSVRCLKN